MWILKCEESNWFIFHQGISSGFGREGGGRGEGGGGFPYLVTKEEKIHVCGTGLRNTRQKN